MLKLTAAIPGLGHHTGVSFLITLDNSESQTNIYKYIYEIYIFKINFN